MVPGKMQNARTTVNLARNRSALNASASKAPSSVSYEARRSLHSSRCKMPALDLDKASNTTSVASILIGLAFISATVRPTDLASAADRNGKRPTFSECQYLWTSPLRKHQPRRCGVFLTQSPLPFLGAKSEDVCCALSFTISTPSGVKSLLCARGGQSQHGRATLRVTSMDTGQYSLHFLEFTNAVPILPVLPATNHVDNVHSTDRFV